MRLRRCLIPVLALLAACSGRPGHSSAQTLQGQDRDQEAAQSHAVSRLHSWTRGNESKVLRP